MNTPELTPVFPPDVQPVRKGVYKTRVLDTENGQPLTGWAYSLFDTTDKIWGCGHDTVENALAAPDFEFAQQNKEWQGLTKEVL